MERNEYIEKGGQKLRLGYTTGSCAAAAAKAATLMLLTGKKVPQVQLRTPKGLDLLLEIEDICFWNEQDELLQEVFPEHQLSAVSCAVRKDSGDDPDITNHALIYAKAARSALPGIRIDGGEGVGRVTKPGLDQPVGSAAINSTPRRMIREAVLEVVESQKAQECQYSPEAQKAPGPRKTPRSPGLQDDQESPGSAFPGLDITIFVPRGRELAAKTFNPKLGIEGGISILGTSGIVVPMSDQALLDTIRVEIRVRKEEGLTILPAAPGNYGRNFFQEKYGFSLDTAVTSSNFIYDTVKMAADAGFTKMLFVGHIGKLVKVAGGIRNTHSQYGDHRMEILTEIAKSVLLENNQEHREKRYGIRTDIGESGTCREAFCRKEYGARTDTGESGTCREACCREEDQRECGPAAESGEPEKSVSGSAQVFESLRGALADCVMTDEAIRILKEYGLAGRVLSEMTGRVRAVMQEWAQGRMQVEVVVFSNVHGELGRTVGALDYMRILQEEISGV